MDDTLTLLTRANAQEILAAFKLDRLGRFQPLAEWLASFPARRLSRQILRFDDLVGQQGLAAAGRYLLDEFTCSTHIEGQQHVPRLRAAARSGEPSRHGRRHGDLGCPGATGPT